MSRLALAIVLASATAFADPPVAPAPVLVAPPDMSDQAIGAELGLATGGRVTAGGLRIAGHYLYQLADRDWFDGTASFTFGGGSPQCFYDRSNAYVCDHGLAQGDAIGLAATVRHYFTGQDTFWPFARGGIGAGITHFGSDGVSGLTIPLLAGAGVRASITPAIAIIGEATLELGLGLFGHDLGTEPQFGLAITGGVEFRL